MFLGVSHNPDFSGIWGVRLKNFDLSGLHLRKSKSIENNNLNPYST